MNFASALSDAEVQLPSNGFSSTLWTPEFGWNNSESEASQAPHSPQLLAALQIFHWFFIADTHRVWVHLAAEMQAGKTGVVSALLRLMFANATRIRITPDRVFVLTGMSDNAWTKQTRERVPSNVRTGVAHSGGFRKVVAALRSLAADNYLENVIIVFDESHIASLASNRPNQIIYNEVARLCPRGEWETRNIRFLTISATDPAKSSICSENRHLSKVVRLLTSEAYQSVESLHNARRIRYNDDFGHLDEPRAIAELQRAVAQFQNPLHHILRPRQGKQEKLEELLKIAVPRCVIIPWDSSTQIIENEGDSSTTLIEDINELLAIAPEVHTFILLKNMFYASKTMDDTHVGILWDRKGGKDDTNLQSLLGRALGYDKSTRTIVYTSKETVENYLGFWRDAIAGLPLPTDIPIERVSRLDKKMAGVQRVRMINGQAVVTVARNYKGPGGGTGVVPEVRVQQFERGYSIFDTQDENEAFARTLGARRRTSYDTDANGFSLCSNSTKKVHSTAELIHFANTCNECSNMDKAASDVQVGEYAFRRYVCYDDLTNNTTRKYMTVWFKRIIEA